MPDPAHNNPYRVSGVATGGNVTQGNIGGEVRGEMRAPIAPNQYFDVGVGLGVTGSTGDPTSGTLSDADRESGVTRRSNNDQAGFRPSVHANYTWFPLRWLGVGGTAGAGYSVTRGETTGVRPSGDEYNTAYCGEGSVFSGDVGPGGCPNRPFGPHAEPGTDNSSRAPYNSHGIDLRVGPRLEVDLTPLAALSPRWLGWTARLQVIVEGGVRALVPVGGPHGPVARYFAAGGLVYTWGGTAAPAPRPPAPRPPAPPTAAPVTGAPTGSFGGATIP